MALPHSTWVANAKARLLAAQLAGGNILDDEDKPTRDDQLPLAHVSISGDQATADGDPAAGEPSFVHTTVLSVAVIDVGNNGAQLKAKLVTHAGVIFQALCTDLLGWFSGEAITRIDTDYEAPPEGQQVTGRVVVAITLRSKTYWPLPDADEAALPDLTTVSIDAGNGIVGNITVPTE